MYRILYGLKKKINRYLERIAEANRRNFGEGRMDCCSINRSPSSRHPAKVGRSEKKS